MQLNDFAMNPYIVNLIYFNFQLLEVVSRYNYPQPQVGENYSYYNHYIFFLIEDQTFTNFVQSFHSQ